VDYLSPDELRAVHTAAVNTPNLIGNWKNMLAGMPLSFQGNLPNIDANQNHGLFQQLNLLNNYGTLSGGLVPLKIWLENAQYFAAGLQTEREFERFKKIVEQKSYQEKSAMDAQKGASIPAGAEAKFTQERIIFTNELIPYAFLQSALRVGGSVVRVLVPRYEGGVPRNKPFSQEPLLGLGTGWLIGSKFVITNHHVINCRSDGELDASPADFLKQGEGTKVEFDYFGNNSQPEIEQVSRLVASDKALDYAVLELQEDSGREPVPLYGSGISMDQDQLIPVNIIQHPRGGPKMLGIRSNLVAFLHGPELGYFTDTEGGSSGSPVCSDSWCVLALHKGSRTSELEYQGKKTAYVNIGIRIDLIIEHLKTHHDGVWTQIGAKLV
jgi:endonuclease G